MASPLLVVESLAATRRYVGTSIGPTDWISIDAARVRRFREATGDGRPAPRGAPLDPASEGVPGALLLSLIPTLLPQLVAIGGWTRGVNAGIDDCRFSAPVPIGGRVRMSAELKRARGVPGGGVRLSFVVRFELEGSDEPACVAQVHYAYFP
jgi:acyl dehydratase